MSRVSASYSTRHKWLSVYADDKTCLDRLNRELRRFDIGLDGFIYFEEESAGTQRFIELFPRLHYVLETQSQDEKELELGLVEHITQFLLELGAGFAYIGRQVPLQLMSVFLFGLMNQKTQGKIVAYAVLKQGWVHHAKLLQCGIEPLTRLLESASALVIKQLLLITEIQDLSRRYPVL